MQIGNSLDRYPEARVVDVKLKSNDKLNVEVTMELTAASMEVVGIMPAESLIDTPPGTLIMREKMIQRLPIH